MMKKLFAIISVLFIPSICQAAPSITFANITSGGVVVGGSGFGTDAGATTPLLFDDFDSGTNGDNLGTQLTGSHPWTLNTTVRAKYSNNQAHSGTQSAYALHDKLHQWSHFEVGSWINPVVESTYYYHTFWFRYATPRPLGTGGETKLIRILGNYNALGFSNPDRPYHKSGGAGSSWFSAWASETYASPTDYWDSTEPIENSWHRVEGIYKQSSAGGVADGSITVLIDGVVRDSFENIATRESSDKRWILFDFFQGMTNWDDLNTGLTWEKWIDDAYLSTSWQRVELCDSATWAARTHCELQRVTAWADTGITAVYNPGSYVDGQTAYIYTVDASGVVSAASDPITITAATPDTAKPTTAHNGASRSATAQSITLACSDNVECNNTQYCIATTACPPSLPYSAPVTVKPGKFLCFRSTDSAANAEDTKCQYFGWPVRCQ